MCSVLRIAETREVLLNFTGVTSQKAGNFLGVQRCENPTRPPIRYRDARNFAFTPTTPVVASIPTLLGQVRARGGSPPRRRRGRLPVRGAADRRGHRAARAAAVPRAAPLGGRL